MEFCYSCLPSSPVSNLLAVPPELILKSIKSLTASDDSTPAALVPAAVSPHLDEFHHLPTRKPASMPLIAHRMQHRFLTRGLKAWEDLASVNLTDLISCYLIPSCSVLVTLALPCLTSAAVIPATGPLHRLFSSSGMIFAYMVSWLTLPFYFSLRGFLSCHVLNKAPYFHFVLPYAALVL